MHSEGAQLQQTSSKITKRERLLLLLLACWLTCSSSISTMGSASLLLPVPSGLASEVAAVNVESLFSMSFITDAFSLRYCSSLALPARRRASRS